MNSMPQYGRRQIVEYNVTGQPTYSYVPLDLRDFLDPEPGDEFFHGEDHDRVVDVLYSAVATLFRADPFLAVFRSVKLVWSDAALPSPAPDMSIVRTGIHQDSQPRRYVIGDDGPLPLAVIEVTSPLFAKLDVEDKLDIYASAGVPEYMIVHVNPATASQSPNLSMDAYRLHAGAYHTISPEATRQVLMLNGRAGFAISASSENIEVYNTRSGQLIDPAPEALQPKSKIAAEATQRAQSLASKLNLFDSE